MKKLVKKMRKPFIKIKDKFLSAHAKFLETKAGKITAVVTDRLAKFFGTKTGKIALIFISFASNLVFVDWKFSAMIIVMIYTHEVGHIWAMKRQDMEVSGIYFIPFIGAAASSKSNFPSHKAGVLVAIMGPIWGFAFAVALGGVYFFTKDPFYAVMASIAAIFNLSNLLPIYPFDGGRIAKSVFSSIHWSLEIIFMVLSGISLFASGILSLYHKHFLLALFFIVFGIIVLLVSLFWEKEDLSALNFVGIVISTICYFVAIAIMLIFAIWIINFVNTEEVMKIFRVY